MAFLRRKRKGTINAKVKVADVFVTTTEITSSHYLEKIGGPMSITMYFLAKCENGEYYELFSGKKLEKEKQPEDGFLFQTFDTPYVQKAEPLTKYLRNPNQVKVGIQSLFDFITEMNVLGRLGALSDEEDEESSQEC